MFETRNLKLDLFALGLLALVIFLGFSLFTYRPADPVEELVQPLNQFYTPDQLVYPSNDQPQNACGRLGAMCADLLFTGVGVGAFYLVFSLAVVDVLLLIRRRIDGPVLRGIGWVGSFLGVITIASMIVPTASPGPVIGSGGYVGTLLAAVLTSHFALVGGVLIAMSVTLGGMMLCTDYLLLRVTGMVFRGAAVGVTKSGQVVRRRRANRDDFEEYEDEDEEQVEEESRIRIKRRAQSDLDTPAYDDEEEDVEVDESEEADEHDDAEVPVVSKKPPKRKGKRKAAAKPDAASGEPIVRTDKAHDEPLRFKRPRSKPAPPEKPKSERELVMESLDQAADKDDVTEYELPGIDLLIEADDVCYDEQEREVRRKAKVLERTFKSFGFNVKVVEVETGPVIAQYEVELEAGLRLSKITGLADDLAIALRVPSVRIVAPIPGKNTVGIEVPNSTRQVVRLREVMEETNGRINKMNIPVFLGKDVAGNPLTVDLSTLPHLLIAGRTGTGKSVCLHAIISSILMTKRPDEVRMLMIAPKMVELSGYGRLPHLMHPVVTDMRKAEAILAWAVDKMEERYALLARAGVRHITSYNQLGEEELIRRLQPETDDERAAIPQHLPFIVIVADEIADLMMTAGKEVEQHIIRLAQKSRAVGIHLILATQKPTVDVITGLIKSNLPARVSFQVASRTDSRVVLDEMGADKLLGNGDMLFLWPGTSTLLRGQGTYLSDDEIQAVVDFVSTGEQHFVNELVNLKVEDPGGGEIAGLKKRDERYESAVDVIVREGRGSVSLLQRSLGVGYGRAARLIDYMAEDGIVGAYAGSQAREVLISLADWEKMQGNAPEPEPKTRTAASLTSPPERRSNKIIPVQNWEEKDVTPLDDFEEEDEYEEEELEDDDDEVAAYDDEEEAEYDDEEEAEYDDEEEAEYDEEDEPEDEEEYDDEDGDLEDEDEYDGDEYDEDEIEEVAGEYTDEDLYDDEDERYEEIA